MEVRLTYRGRAVTDADVALIHQIIAAHPTASRRTLSKKLCEAWNWVQPNGRLRDMVCRSLMLRLHREGRDHGVASERFFRSRHVGLPVCPRRTASSGKYLTPIDSILRFQRSR